MSFDSWGGGNDWDYTSDPSKQHPQHFQEDLFDHGSEHFSYNIETNSSAPDPSGDFFQSNQVTDNSAFGNNYYNPQTNYSSPNYFYPGEDPNSLYGQMSMQPSGSLDSTTKKRSLSTSPFSPNNFDEDEPPLLEELGINFSHIQQKTLTVLHPTKTADPTVCQDNDLTGALVFAVAFGTALLLAGKIHFNYIYGIGVMGSLCMYSLLNLMSTDGCGFFGVVSVLGYCLLPLVGLSTLAVFISLKSIFGLVLSLVAVGWASLASSKLFVAALGMHCKQLLIAYPCALLYGVFALLTVF